MPISPPTLLNNQLCCVIGLAADSEITPIFYHYGDCHSGPANLSFFYSIGLPDITLLPVVVEPLVLPLLLFLPPHRNCVIDIYISKKKLETKLCLAQSYIKYLDQFSQY